MGPDRTVADAAAILTGVRRMVGAAALVAGLAIAAAAAAGQDGPTPASAPAGVRLRNVRWQLLPDEVGTVCVGPDRRVWYVLGKPDEGGPADVAGLKDHIAKQFAEPAPMLRGCRPGLFDQAGRVWFVGLAGEVLLGYDGRSWIERHAEAGRTFCGNCPNHGRIASPLYNVAAGGAVFFPDGDGLHCYDGKAWCYRALGPAGPGRPAGRRRRRRPIYPTSLAAEPDGKALVAVGWGAPCVLWRWRGGKWDRLPFPAELGEEGTMGQAAFGPHGRLYLSHTQGARTIWTSLALPADADEGLADRFAEVLKQLSDDRFAVRDKASAALEAMGPAAAGLAKAALKTARDPEVISRLELLIEKLEKSGEGGLGGYEVQRETLFWGDARGRLYVASTSIRSGGRGGWNCGTLVLDAAGGARFLGSGAFPMFQVSSPFVGK